MTVRNLDALFNPHAVAVIGASRRPQSVGAVVMERLLAAGFAGPIMPINPHYEAVAGVLTYPDVESLPKAPDLAVICTPPHTVPDLIAELGARGTRAAIVLTAGLSQERDAQGRSLTQAMLEAARPHLLRVLGPNCVGLLVPGIGLNASFAHVDGLSGGIAFVAQSGALCTTVLDWARAHGVGFSHFVSLGDAADVDFGDVLDYLGSDPATRAILLYIEAVTHARKFMSAARAAARNKPVIAIKAGRAPEGARAARSHTGALAGADNVYDAAIRRAGMLRVYVMNELFDAAETLAFARRPQGDRLAIVTNGGGPGVLATDALVAGGGRPAVLSAESVAQLDEVLPATWSRGNPVDIIGDAPGERYRTAMERVLADSGVDAVLAMHAPTATADAMEAAQVVIETAGQARKTVLTCWLGESAVERPRQSFSRARIPTYETPEAAVEAFLQLTRYRANQAMLMETPPAIPAEFSPDREAARSEIAAAVSSGLEMMDERAAKAVLSAYDIPVVETRAVATAAEAEQVAESLGYPVALKILSPDISHKSDLGGVALNVSSPAMLREAAAAMTARIGQAAPDARLEGFTVQPMIQRPGAHEILVGATTDPTFGPILVFGHGGKAVEVIADRVVGLPPLNMALARQMVAQTRIAKLLAGYRDEPPVDLDAVHLTLVKLSQLICDFAEIQEIDINPLLVDTRGVIALDARMRVAPAEGAPAQRLTIRPYPRELEDVQRLPSGREVVLRPIRPEDEPAHLDFFNQLSEEDVRFRFFGMVRAMPHSELARFTQIDYDREMAFIATELDTTGKPETLGVVRSIADPDNENAEFAIIVRSDLKGQGLGRTLLEKMIRYCRGRGTARLVGQVLTANEAMRGLARALGFVEHPISGSEAVEVVLDLQA